MIWPAMLFNLCVGLLFAAYLLRAVRRFERRADAILADLDRRHAENMHKYDIARDEIRTSLHEQTDRAIAEMRAKSAGPHLPPISGNANIVLDGITVTATATVSPPPGEQLPTEQELAALPRWARVAFAARCARRVLPLFRQDSPDIPEKQLVHVTSAIDFAERAASRASVSAEAAKAAGDVAHEAAVATTSAQHSIAGFAAHAAGLAAGYAFETCIDPEINIVNPADKDRAAAAAVEAAVRAGANIAPVIRRDFDHLAWLAKWQHWEDDAPVPPSVFGPLWPDAVPEGWPSPENPATEIVIEFLVPDDMTTDEAVELVKELSAALCSLDLAGGGHGIAIQPPLEITAPSLVPAGSPV